MLGYSKKLYILTFDHRGSLVKALFGKKTILGNKEKKMIKEYKKVIFEGFLSAWNRLGKREEYGIFVDDEYCQDIIKKAKKKGIITAIAVEKSGRKLFAFEHGKDFGEVILKIKPDFVKVLVRYNPRHVVRERTVPRDKEKNVQQLEKLKALNDWCKENDFKLITELLILPSDADLRRVRNKKEIYDLKLRPGLTLKAIQEFYQAGINPDIWKIEAMEERKMWKPIVKTIRSGKRKALGVLMLGRGASVVKVKDWIRNCPKDKVNGFAIGRTIWLRVILDLHNKKINRKEAVRQIAENYLEMIGLWEKGS